ncbi:hypothetical protein ZIOFF_017947 [Zingiber officinale]|uniref:Uncharacterized protein n=1 Tax=Zingiber officinale TaxID=94328 RepID=A0A8J5HCD0_ZINOF|nr:hypothetical protein ZIOFF_017947 [Zingiber officinale]
MTMHSIKYSDMDNIGGTALMRGKRVTVVGSGKTTFERIMYMRDRCTKFETPFFPFFANPRAAVTDSLRTSGGNRLRLVFSHFVFFEPTTTDFSLFVFFEPVVTTDFSRFAFFIDDDKLLLLRLLQIGGDNKLLHLRPLESLAASFSISVGVQLQEDLALG